MKWIKKILKLILAILLIPVIYIFISIVLTTVQVNYDYEYSDRTETVYLETNGIHLNLILGKDQLDTRLREELVQMDSDSYFAFGWGDRNFYLHTPLWADLTFKNACIALLIKSPSLMHVTRYSKMYSDWVEIRVTPDQLSMLNDYILDSFYKDQSHKIILLENKGYSINDDFYEATGSFSCFKTCNTWVNTGLKKSNIKACLWTPFDFGVLGMHKIEKERSEMIEEVPGT